MDNNGTSNHQPVQPVATRPKLLICAPGSEFSIGWLVSWSSMLNELSPEYIIALRFASSNNIYSVRNQCATGMVIESESDVAHLPDYVLWIDSDNLVSAQGFRLLRDGMRSKPDAIAVGGWYMINVAEPNVAAGWDNGQEHHRPTIDEIEAATDLIGVDYIGFGFLLMDYRKLRDLGPNPFNARFHRTTGEMEGDDISFCELAREHGHKFYLHPGVHVPHLKLLMVPVSQRKIDIPERAMGDAPRPVVSLA